MPHRLRRSLLALCVVLSLLDFGGCARFPGGISPSDLPDRVLIVKMVVNDRVRDDYYYYFAIDADGDETDGPLPVVRGPFWGNGWGTGSMSYFVEYHSGEYRVYKPAVVASLVPGTGTAGQGGIQGVSGTPADALAGTHVIDIEAVNLGVIAVSPSGTIASATNTGQQAAGALTVSTDATGAIVAGSIEFSPAEIGGRLLPPAENTEIVRLNAGGEVLAGDTFAALGIEITLAAAPAAAQTLTIDPTTANIVDRFEAFFGTGDYTERGSIYANDRHEGPEPVLPGVQFQTGDLSPAVNIEVATQFDVTPDYIGPLFRADPPGIDGDSSRTLSFYLDLAQIGDPQGRLDINFITTDELVLDPAITGPKNYDGLGYTGNSFVTIRTDINYSYENANADTQEGTADTSIAAIDLRDWEAEVRLTTQQ